MLFVQKAVVLPLVFVGFLLAIYQEVRHLCVTSVLQEQVPALVFFQTAYFESSSSTFNKISAQS